MRFFGIFNNWATRFLMGIFILYVVFKYLTGSLDDYLKIFVISPEILISFLLFFILTFINRKYLKDNIKELILIGTSLFIFSLGAYIETYNYFLNIIIIFSLFIVSFQTYKYAVIQLRDKYGITLLNSYLLYGIYTISMLFINNNFVIYSLLNSVVLILILAYTTFKPANLKFNIDYLQEMKDYTELSKYISKKRTKIHPFILSGILSIFYISNIIFFHNDFQVIYLFVFTIATIFIIYIIATKNPIKKLGYRENNIKELFEYIKDSIKEKIAKKGSK